MPNGLFITLEDERSLALYLREGVFSQHQGAQLDDTVHHSSNHYKILADYACARPGTHVFFFRNRTIYYGGQIQSDGDPKTGAFYLNGPTSPMGRRADAGLGWDETTRSDFTPNDDTPGTFERQTRNGTATYAQPFVLRFDTSVPDAGAKIRSDDLYFELGDYPFPFQSNTIRGSGFVPLGPGETRILRTQLREATETYDPRENEVDVPDVRLDVGALEPYQPEYGVQALSRDTLTSEAHLEASVIANPALLPDALQPASDVSVVRQAPISPLKPMQVDAVDIAYYHPDFEDGLYPQRILELKYTTASSGPDGDAGQIERYRTAIDKMATHYLDPEPDAFDVGMLAPQYARDFGATLSDSTRTRVTFRQYDATPDTPAFTSTLSDH